MATGITEKRLFRANDGAFVGGVCAGLAEYFELDSIVVRILAVLLTTLTLGLAAIVYVVLWLNLPLEPERSSLYEVMPESAESSAFGCVDCSSIGSEHQSSDIPLLARLAVAAGLMVLFLAVSMNVSPLLPGTSWWQFWPLGLLMVGLCLIIIPIRTKHEAIWHAVGIVLTSFSASALPMSLGIISWNTVNCAFGLLWPLVVFAVALFAVGLHSGHNAYILGSAFLLVAFCVLGILLCAVPGELQSLLLNSPTGRVFRIDILL